MEALGDFSQTLFFWLFVLFYSRIFTQPKLVNLAIIQEICSSIFYQKALFEFYYFFWNVNREMYHQMYKLHLKKIGLSHKFWILSTLRANWPCACHQKFSVLTETALRKIFGNGINNSTSCWNRYNSLSFLNGISDTSWNLNNIRLQKLHNIWYREITNITERGL